ncbi:MAG: hypothetical protein Tsb0015_07570 [Simkaniaceae bacterium]
MSISFFTAVPVEIKLEILSYLSEEDLTKNIVQISKEFRDLANHGDLWKRKTFMKFTNSIIREISNDNCNGQDWKKIFFTAKKKLQEIRKNSVNKHKFSARKSSYMEVYYPGNFFLTKFSRFY